MTILHIPSHKKITEKLTYFHEMHKIPNIIFHGQSGSGKKTIVSNFINLIYDNNKEMIKKNVLYTNCAHGGKGIKFIREELKFFAKMHIHSNGGDVFKSIVLLNADKLTIDAQSALRRCIELFTHSTRFFIIVEDKYKLLKPILSRFCEIYIPEPMMDEKHGNNGINLYQYNLTATFKPQKKIMQSLKKECLKLIEKNAHTPLTSNDVMLYATSLYEKGYNAILLCDVLETNGELFTLSPHKINELLFCFTKIRKEFRNEKLLIFFILHFLFFDKEVHLDELLIAS